MFGFSVWEIFLILVIALLVVGPERLPGLARTIGTWVRKIKKFVANAKAELDSEFNLQDMKSLLNSQESEIAKLRALVEETRQEVSDSGRSMLSAVDSVKASVTTSVATSATTRVATEEASAEAVAPASAQAVPPVQVPVPELTHAPASPAAAAPLPALSFEEEIRALEAASGQSFARPFAAPPAEPAVPDQPVGTLPTQPPAS